MIKHLYIFSLLMIEMSIAGLAQSLNKAKLDSLFEGLDINNKAMGSIAISKNGNLLYSRTIGYTHIDKKLLSNENTKYRIGSVSKIFTAVIILQLVEEGKLNLFNTLNNYFPKFPNSNLITISMLLNHRSGISNMTHIKSREVPRTQNEMLTILAKKRSQFRPGTKAVYSNSNFLLLGYIIEKVCNQPYKDVLKERITSKLGLFNTYYGQKTIVENNECFSYLRNKNWEQLPQTDLSIPGGSGAIVSTPTDMVKFMEALFSGKLVKQSSLDEMQTMVDGYGMGLGEFEFETKKAIGHTGGIDGYESVLAYFPTDSLTIAYCSNGKAYPTEDVVIGSLNIYFDKLYFIPDFTGTTVKAKHLSRYTGFYLSNETRLRIEIKKDKKTLVARTEGFSPYKLTAISPIVFKCDIASVLIEFDHRKKTMKLKRGNMAFTFTKAGNK